MGRRFSAPAPDQLWVADISSILAGEGWLHLATIHACCSKRLVEWSMASHMRA